MEATTGPLGAGMAVAIAEKHLGAVPLTYVFTHDSIGVGEDGPTHQPIDITIDTFGASAPAKQ